jgi:carotenoid cleavage dioxygenase
VESEGGRPEAGPRSLGAAITARANDPIGASDDQTANGKHALGEFVFHPTSPDAAEDDGVLMGYVYDRTADRSELAILDAQTLQDVASIKLPHRVPAGFHGNWIPTSAA